ncbi:PRA1 family protein-domain-containing protein [Spinellus fusiger]|nr:PRA1 family protein-domain-containing protein [Spinellus fusiger]
MSSQTFLSEAAQSQLGAAATAIGNDPRLSFLGKLREGRLANLRPLGDFFDKDRISFNTSFQTISQRWNYNLQYFSANYFLIILVLGIYAVITNWLLLFTIVFIFGGFFLISRANGSLTIAGNTFSTSSLYTGYAVVSFLLLLFSGATGAIFWIIGAAALIILGHAALLEPSIEGDFADGQV